MSKAIFIATTHEAAAYWSGQWGYAPREVLTIDTTNREAISGLRPDPEIPVFLCGPTAEGQRRIQLGELVEEMQARGFVIRDAQEMGGEYRPVLP